MSMLQQSNLVDMTLEGLCVTCEVIDCSDISIFPCGLNLVFTCEILLLSFRPLRRPRYHFLGVQMGAVISSLNSKQVCVCSVM